MSRLNRNNSNWSFEERRKINENWDILENLSSQSNNQNQGVKQIAEEALRKANESTSKSNESIVRSNQAISNSNNAVAITSNISDRVDSNTQKITEVETKADLSLISANEANQNSAYTQSQLDQVILESGDSNPEVVQSRGRYVNLRSRLDSERNQANSQLSKLEKDKAERSEVYLRSKGININDLDEQTRQTFLEAQNIDVNYVLGEKNVKSENVDDNAINASHTDFIELPGNIFDTYSNIGLRGAIRDQAPAVVTDTVGARSAIIKVNPNSSYLIEKSASDRFRVATFENYPFVDNASFRFIKDQFTGNESEDTTLYVRTSSSERYIVIYCSITQQEPDLRVVEISPLKIVRGKNIFDGTYDRGFLRMADNTYQYADNDKTAIVKIDPLTTYTISKTVSNRFRVALSDKFPSAGYPVDYIKTTDEGNSYTFTSRESQNYVIIFTSSDGDAPSFLQVEKGSEVTAGESYGYKFSQQAREINNTGSFVSAGNDYLRVEDFRTGTESDSVVIQRAFDAANRQIVSFESGREYTIDNTVIANAVKVRGIYGNNATLMLNTDITALRLEGSLGATANPDNTGVRALDLNEGNTFIERLRVTSTNGLGSGIELERIISGNVESCNLFYLKNGLIIKGRNRNLIVSNCHIRDNLENGILFNKTNLHQINMTGIHAAYCKNVINLIDCEIANWQMSSCDLENNSSSRYGRPNSVINIETTPSGNTIMWELNFSALTIQDHGGNLKPLININVKTGELLNFVIGSSHISNSAIDQPFIFINGGRRVGINNITMKNDNALNRSIVLGNDNESVIISSCHLPAPISYGTVNKLLISNNIATGFVLNNSSTSTVLITNNL